MKLKPYLKYKDSGIQWIGEIPEGWRIEKLKRFVYFQEGPGLRNWQFSEDGMKVLTVTNITLNGINWEKNELFISDEEYKTTYKHFSLEENDIVFASSGASWGKSTIVKEKDLPAILNTSTIRCHALKNSKLNHKYLRLFVDSDIFTESILQLITGSCQPNFGPSHLNQIAIIIPPEIQQMAIEKYLNTKNSEINQIKEKNKRLIELLKEKRNALINHVVTKGLDPNVKLKDSGIDWIGEIPEGWEVKKIKQFSRLFTGSTPEGGNEKYWDGDITWITPADLSIRKKYISDSKRKITKEGYLSCGTTSVNKDAIILATRAPIGYPTIVKEKLCFNQGCKAFEIEKEYISDYCYYFLNTYEDVLISLGNATTFGELSTYNLASFLILKPPKPEQQKIVEHLDKATSKIDKTIQVIENKINLLEEYKKSLIHYVVTGKVDVRGVLA